MSDVLSITFLDENRNVMCAQFILSGVPASDFLFGYWFVQTALSQLRKTSVVAMAKQTSPILYCLETVLCFSTKGALQGNI